jgi:hypothetical protein
MVKHLNELHYLLDQLDKIDQIGPIHEKIWLDITESWMAMAA